MLIPTLLTLIGFSQSAWPSFRGLDASGVAAGQKVPVSWNVESGESIAWKSAIPGLAHSSPIVWGGKVYVTTAVSSQGRAYLKHGLYGSGDAADDHSIQKWRLLCLSLADGTVLWDTLVTEGEPIDKRHIKATYANSTPSTDGEHVVALFGSEGLYCVSASGKVLWKKDLGRMNMGAYDAPTYEWGPASSPIIYDDMVIVQVDTQEKDFLIACHLRTGETKWKTARDELPSWGTPTVVTNGKSAQIVTNGSNHILGYDLTGNELWRLGGSSQITAPTPVFNEELIIVASGRRPEKPIFAIRPGAKGDLTLPEDSDTSEYIAWRVKGRGPYMPTPLIYGQLLFTLQNQGILDCYDLTTGKEIYRERISHGGGGFSASPVACNEKLYLSGEDGDVFVIQVGKEFQQLNMNQMNEVVMATPAIADNTLLIRGRDHLYAIRTPGSD